MPATSQTVTTVINYQTWAGASGCNIFSSSPSVNGFVHQSTVGQPTYSTTNAAVDLDATTNGTSGNGTEYRVAYNFKPGYSYSITVNAYGIYNSGGSPNLRLRITGSTGYSTSCLGPQSIDGSTSGTLTLSQPISNVNYNDYSYNFGTLTGTATIPYVTVANVPNLAGSSLQTILIRKITIVETAVAPELTLTPKFFDYTLRYYKFTNF